MNDTINIINVLENYWHIWLAIISIVAAFYALKYSVGGITQRNNEFRRSVDKRINVLEHQYDRLHRIVEDSNKKIDDNLKTLINTVQTSHQQQQQIWIKLVDLQR